MSLQQDSRVWFCLIEGEQRGPLSPQQLRALVKDGVLKRHHLVWKLGKERRVTASQVRGLFDDVPQGNEEASENGVPERSGAFDVFIAHSTDDKTTADAICAELERNKIRCWIAPRDVLPGVSYGESIIDGINSSRAMIVVFSASSNGSQQVIREVERGVSKGIPIIPFRIEDIKPSKSMEYFLSAPHWLDALTKPLEEHIQRLTTVMIAVLDPQKPSQSTNPASPLKKAGLQKQPSALARALRKTAQWVQSGVAYWFRLPVIVRVASVLLPLVLWAIFGLLAQLFPDQLAQQYAEYKSTYLRGRGSVAFLRQAASTSFPQWQKRAESGDSIAQLFLGRCYQEGIVVNKDESLAMKWLERSAAKGNDYAMMNLGSCYGSGLGVPVDKTKAMQLYLEAYKMKNPASANNIGWLYREGFGGKPNPELALEWFRKSADLGNTIAMRTIGDCYRFGTGVPIDLEESERWNQRAADAGNAFLVGKFLGNRFAKHFAVYLQKAASTETKASALSAIRDLKVEYERLDLACISSLFSGSELNSAKTGLEDLPEIDPLRTIYQELVKQYVNLYENASRSERIENLPGFSLAAEELVKGWYLAREYDEVCRFWDRCYRDIPLSELDSSNEFDSFVRQLNWSVSSLLFCGKRKEASEKITEVLEFCDRVLGENPWEWYLKESYAGFCFDTAAAWHQLGEYERSKPLLKRAWEKTLRQFGKESLLNDYAELPLKGGVPEDASENDKEFFQAFGSDSASDKKSSGIKRFTIPCDFAGTKYPFHVYIITGPRGYTELQDQFRWLKEMRGGEVPKDARDSFLRLNKIAAENKVDFMELCVYALGEAAKSPEERLDLTNEKLAERKRSYDNDKTIENGKLLVETYVERGEICVELKRYREALQELRNAIRICIELQKTFKNDEWSGPEADRLRLRVGEIDALQG